jgi:hypothetical protein
MNPTTLVGIHRTLVAPSQAINYANSAGQGDTRPRIVFRIPKIGTHFAGKLSEIRIRLTAGGAEGFEAGFVAQSLWNFVRAINVYVGQTKVVSKDDAYWELMVNERLQNHPSLFYDTCAYYSGWNDKLRTNYFATDDASAIDEANYRDDSNIFYQVRDNINDTANTFQTFDFTIPMVKISDMFLVDTPLHLLSQQDILIEMFLDLTNVAYGLRTGTTEASYNPTVVGLQQAELYCVSYTEPFETIQNQQSIAIPFTNYHRVITPDRQYNQFMFSLARQRLKKLILALSSPQNVNPYLGRCYSSFLLLDPVTSTPANLELNIRYNDKLYFPEDVPVDTRLFSYANDCSLFGSACFPAGSYDFSDGQVISTTIEPIGNNIALQTGLGGFLNFAIIPFHLVEQNSVLASNLSLSGELINDKPILITLKNTVNAPLETPANVVIVAETQRVMTIQPNDVMIVNA